MRDFSKKIARAGVIAGIYVALTFVTMPIASGTIQIRIAEAMTLLPLLFIEAVPALFIGCMLANLITGCALQDVVFGSLITLLAGISTYITGKLIKKTWIKLVVGGLFPVLLNAFFLPIIWYYCYGELEYLYYIEVLFMLAGQGISVYAFGVPLYLKLKKWQEKSK